MDEASRFYFVTVAALGSRIAGILLLFGLCAADPAMAAPTDALTIESRIALGDVGGRIDHLAVDLARRRLFVAELGNGSLGVVDIAGGKLLQRIKGLKEPQGVGYVPGSDMLYVASAGDGTVRRYRGDDFVPLGVLKLGDDADNVRIDAAASQVIVGYGSGALAILDAASGGKLGEIRLPAHPESFQLEPSGSRIFVNVPDARQIAVVDRKAMQKIADFGVPNAGANFPMAIDETGRLAVVYRSPPELVLFDSRNGSIIARLPSCGDADDLFFDARRQRIYISCGEGVVDIVERQGDAYRELGRVPTSSGARTSLFVPALDRLYVAARAGLMGPGAAILVLKPQP